MATQATCTADGNMSLLSTFFAFPKSTPSSQIIGIINLTITMTLDYNRDIEILNQISKNKELKVQIKLKRPNICFNGPRLLENIFCKFLAWHSTSVAWRQKSTQPRIPGRFFPTFPILPQFVPLSPPSEF